MNPNLTYLLCALILSFCLELKGQQPDTTHQETIVKMENTYGKGRTKWLKQNGFDTDNYQWDNPEINLYLDQALKSRSTGDIMGFTGLGIFVVGLAANAMGRLAKDIGSSKPDEPYRVFKAPYYLGGALIVSSIPFHIKSNKKLKRAIQKTSN